MKNKIYQIVFLLFSICYIGNTQELDTETKFIIPIEEDLFDPYYGKRKLQIDTTSTSIERPKNVTNLSITATSNYIWRDIVTNYGAIQPSTDYVFGKSGFSLNIWSSFGINHDTNDLEISSTLNYNWDISKHINTSIGGVYYYAPAIEGVSNSNFGELYLNVTLPKVVLQPSATIFVSDAKAFYTRITMAHQLYSWKRNTISLDGSLGYRFNDSNDNNGVRDINLGASASFELNDLTITLFSRATLTGKYAKN